jgi:PAP2 superfamily C-terminal
VSDRFERIAALSTRLIISAVALVLWFWTQHLLGTRTPHPNEINDALQNLFAGLNAYFGQAPRAANALLIVSSALIDALGLFLIARWISAGTVRPFLGLVLLLAMRQVMQALCALPTPPNMIWHYPGFPSLLVTYNVGNDFFFSGHTALAVFGAIELRRLRRPWLTALAGCVVVFEIATVLILRAHYTMDVFTGALAALWVSSLCDSISPRLEALVNGGDPALLGARKL